MSGDGRPFVGVTVLMDYVLNEGAERVLDNLCELAGATAVATNPTVTAPSEEGRGSFQPPIDAGASVRLFDRPLWGKRSLWVRGGPSFAPRPELYRQTPYAPRAANELTERHGGLVARFIDAAHERGLKVYFQLGAAQPPGLREEDTPRLPDGALPTGRMAHTASLAAEAVRTYNRAYVQDLLEHYPAVDGLRVDWPEYPCYTLGEVFADFSPQALAFAARLGLDVERLRADVLRLWELLHGGLTNDWLDAVGCGGGWAALVRRPGLADWLHLKAELSADLLRDWREALDAAGGAGLELSANAFAPPYTLLTGLDFGRAAQWCGSVSPKLYTMHWSLMVKFWGDALLAATPGFDESRLVRALVALMDLADDEGRPRLADYGYPEPDQPHPIPDGPQVRKLNQAVALSGGGCPVYALVHGYGPLDDFGRRLRLVRRSDADGVWVNRYGYLSDDKLRAIGEL